MKIKLLIIAAAIFSSICFSSCNEEEIKPINTTNNSSKGSVDGDTGF